ncbi:hypothetical protein GJ496_003926 [Pomphorhynchus laevis]|nr:hypothetical protein GJ496_009419 [Pomphorhynchus laevis]KAI0983755.1 hypothetical protein GJ496_003926 [Pomphorhynchus laevis]
MECILGIQHINAVPESTRKMHSRMQAMNNDTPYGLMLDYADFNIHHTLRIQSHVFEEIVRLTMHRSWLSDYIRAAGWCAQAMLNSNTYYPDSKELIRVKQGIFSRLRGTAFINTILNHSYFAAAREVMELTFPTIMCQKTLITKEMTCG